jgi:hypothetical protein
MKPSSQVVEPFFCDDDIKVSSPRNWGFTFAAILPAISILPIFKNHPLRIWPLPIALTLFFCAIAFPNLLRWPNHIWFLFGRLLQRVTQPVFMALFFFAFITPAGFLMRLFKRNDLNLEWRKNAPSYWINRDAQNSFESMKHLF